MNHVGATVIVKGVVQGVGYRYFCYQKATNLGLTGSVKNRPDHSVEIALEGDRSAVEALIKDLRVGPSSASVADIEVVWAKYTGQMTRFEITH